MLPRASHEDVFRTIVRQRLEAAKAAVESLLASPLSEMKVADTRGAVQSLDHALFAGFHLQYADWCECRPKPVANAAKLRPTPLSINELV